MKDLTLKFADRVDFSAFMDSTGYYDDESMQDNILIDVIGNVYKETGELNEDGEPVCVKEDGYFVNVRIINDVKTPSIFDEYVVAVEHQLRGWM
ncbi:hypothetical protein FSI95_003460 [Escherichia coli]|nr:hypothetical protein [Escherichia coli]